jgi:acetoin utilization protein AcuB
VPGENMLIKDRMTSNPICGNPEMPVTEIQELMREKKFRHLPITDGDDNLVGLVTQRSLLRALPSDVSGFSRFEISYILAKIKAKDVMTKEVITIDENIAIEDAARIMADEKIGCLPVCDGDKMVGIITDNDLFGIMVDLMGGRRKGLRMTISQPDRAGAIARLTTAIAKEGGFMAVFLGYPGKVPETWISVCKVTNLDVEKLEEIIGNLEGTDLLDIREATL